MAGNEAQSRMTDSTLLDKDIEKERPRLSVSSDSHSENASARGKKFAIQVAYNEVKNLHLRLRFVNVLLFFLPPNTMSRLRGVLYRLCGFRIGKGSLLLGSLNCSGEGNIFARLQIGERCILNTPLHLDLNGDITIGNKVCIGHHVVIITTDHLVGKPNFRCGQATPKPTVIEAGCWIGAGAILLPGVTIGAGSVVSAGAVVAADVPPNKVVVGNPARPVKTLEE